METSYCLITTLQLFLFQVRMKFERKNTIATLTSIRHTISCAKLIIIWIFLCAYHFDVLSKWRCDTKKNPTQSNWNMIFFLYEVYLNVVLAINPKLFDSQLEHGVRFVLVFSSHFKWILARVDVVNEHNLTQKSDES